MAITVDWTRVTAPVLLPLSLVDVKAQCRIAPDQTVEDPLLTGYSWAAGEAAEQYLGRGLTTQTWQAQLSDWAEELRLPMAAPLQSVTSVQYYNDAGILTTLAPSAYGVDLVAEPGRLARAPNASWPTLQSDRRRRVVVTYVVGWLTIAALPALITQGLRLHVLASNARGGLEADRAIAAAQALWTLYGRLPFLPPTEMC